MHAQTNDSAGNEKEIFLSRLLKANINKYWIWFVLILSKSSGFVAHPKATRDWFPGLTPAHKASEERGRQEGRVAGMNKPPKMTNNPLARTPLWDCVPVDVQYVCTKWLFKRDIYGVHFLDTPCSHFDLLRFVMFWLHTSKLSQRGFGEKWLVKTGKN